MDDQVYNIAEAIMHLSRLIDRVEHGERITIARNYRPVALLSPAALSPADVLARIDAVRERIRDCNSGQAIRRPGEAWRDLIEDGRRTTGPQHPTPPRRAGTASDVSQVRSVCLPED